MAFKPEEIKKFQDMADDMAKRIEDRESTSNEASIAYSKIGRVCAKARAEDAALTAKRSTRAASVTQFQTARQNRNAKKGSTTPQSAAQNAGAQRQQKTS